MRCERYVESERVTSRSRSQDVEYMYTARQRRNRVRGDTQMQTKYSSMRMVRLRGFKKTSARIHINMALWVRKSDIRDETGGET